MRIGRCKTVAWEMFATVRHAALQHALHHALGQQRHDTRVPAEGAVTDHAAVTMVKVEYRREAQIYAAGAQFAAQHIATATGGVAGVQRAGALL